MTLTIIAAMTPTRVIADSKKPGMLWHIPEELKHFRKMTFGKKCIVGRKTAEVMPVLHDRLVYVLTESDISHLPYYQQLHQHDIPALVDSEDEVMVIGGAKVYESLMPYANKAFISEVNRDVVGDIYMPNFTGYWKEVGGYSNKEAGFYFIEYHRL